MSRRGWLAPAPPGGRFGLVLLLLISSYLLSAFTSGRWVAAAQVLLFLVVAALAVRGSGLTRRAAVPVIVSAAMGSAIAVALDVTHPSDVAAGVASLWAALILLSVTVIIIRRILAQREVSLQSIFGAVSAYMIIGLMFATIYAAINKFDGGTFFASGAAGNTKTFQYFSFTTLTTLGYGDYTAADSGGRAVAVMEALLGQVFLATLVARLVSLFRPPAREVSAGNRHPGQRPPSRHRPAAPVRWPSRSGRPARPDGTTASRRPSPRARGPGGPKQFSTGVQPWRAMVTGSPQHWQPPVPGRRCLPLPGRLIAVDPPSRVMSPARPAQQAAGRTGTAGHAQPRSVRLRWCERARMALRRRPELRPGRG